MSTVQEQLILAFSSVSAPGMSQATNAFVSVLPIASFHDFLLANLYIGLFYFMTYFLVGGKPVQIQDSSNTRTPFPRQRSEWSPLNCRSRWA